VTRYLLDTNVLVYVHDDRSAKNQQQATLVLERVAGRSEASISVQSLTEFAAVALRKFQPPMSPHVLYEQLDRLAASLPVLAVTPAVVLEAVRGVDVHSLSFFDAQIWAVARLNQIPIVLTEDFSAEAVVEGVRFRNPFASNFEIEDL
jgi:predicted nucleic acid-binding protein